MTNDTALWVLGIAFVPALCWGVYMTTTLCSVKKLNEELLHMHKHADEYGFGTVEMKQITRDLSVAIKSLTHYIRWMCEKETGETPPPPLNDGR